LQPHTDLGTLRAGFTQTTASTTSQACPLELPDPELSPRAPQGNNISGLQIAGLIAHPSVKAAQRRLAGEPLPPNFSGEFAGILLQAKYGRSRGGATDG
jgi:hypothetical protein